MTIPSSRPDHEVLIIGTGFAGLGMAIALHKAGMHDFTLVEKEPDLGGTWLVNNYPGCACDVQSHMYSFSFEPNPRWSREFATQPEILAYLRACAEKYGLRQKISFATQAVGASYDAERALWRVELADAPQVARAVKERGLQIGDYLERSDPVRPQVRVVTARFVVGAMGGLSTPAYPKLPGLARFQGKTFHSQQWDHGYDLRGKRVAVIGTGASAIQFVPEVQRVAKELQVYQRSAAWILPKPDRAISRVERALYAGVPGLRLLKRAGLYTRLEGRAVAFVVRPELLHVAEAAAHLYRRISVPNATLRKKLTPDYSMGCKRVLMSNNWYSAVSQPNVEVVTRGIAEVREHSIVDADGTERPVDAIIYGTGFRVADLVPRGVIFGRGGRDIVDGWPRGPEAYKGITVTGCPNLFLLVGPNTGLGHNSIIYMIESQVRYVLEALKHAQTVGAVELEVRADAQQKFNERIDARSHRTVWERGGCTSYYLDPQTGRNIAVWPGFTFEYRAITRSFDVTRYHVKRAAELPAASRAESAA